MSILDYFKSVPSLSVDEVRAFLKDKTPGEYNLLDVRQPKEYKQEHLPGAKLIPLNELHERMGELSGSRPTIVYCAIGGRSRAAASLLEESGFAPVYNMKGGIKAWHGLTAEGPPETGTAYFSETEKPEEILLLAWALEEGTRRFYEAMAGQTDDASAKKTYTDLKEVEVAHQQAIVTLYREVTGRSADRDSQVFDRYLSSEEGVQFMEGQLKVAEVLAWAHDRPLREVLEYSIALEAQLYDLYFRLKDRFKEGSLHQVFSTLAAEEKKHLDQFSHLLDQNLEKGTVH
jgi:rhodanese-related sulfurtransferase/rubrerythrin